MPSLSSFLPTLKSREIALDQERRDAFVARFRIHIREQQEQARFGGIGDPELAAGEAVVIARVDGARGQRERVRARAGFG